MPNDEYNTHKDRIEANVNKNLASQKNDLNYCKTQLVFLQFILFQGVLTNQVLQLNGPFQSLMDQNGAHNSNGEASLNPFNALHNMKKKKLLTEIRFYVRFLSKQYKDPQLFQHSEKPCPLKKKKNSTNFLSQTFNNR